MHCIFGVMYMHFWYAMHRHLWWCLVGVITIVQCIFGALFLGLGCNIFLVLRLWCYALSAISRRLATAVAHLLYCIYIIHNTHICIYIYIHINIYTYTYIIYKSASFNAFRHLETYLILKQVVDDSGSNE